MVLPYMVTWIPSIYPVMLAYIYHTWILWDISQQTLSVFGDFGDSVVPGPQGPQSPEGFPRAPAFRRTCWKPASLELQQTQGKTLRQPRVEGPHMPTWSVASRGFPEISIVFIAGICWDMVDPTDYNKLNGQRCLGGGLFQFSREAGRRNCLLST